MQTPPQKSWAPACWSAVSRSSHNPSCRHVLNGAIRLTGSVKEEATWPCRESKYIW